MCLRVTQPLLGTVTGMPTATIAGASHHEEFMGTSPTALAAKARAAATATQAR